jgi:hypothetical protein
MCPQIPCTVVHLFVFLSVRPCLMPLYFVVFHNDSSVTTLRHQFINSFILYCIYHAHVSPQHIRVFVNFETLVNVHKQLVCSHMVASLNLTALNAPTCLNASLTGLRVNVPQPLIRGYPAPFLRQHTMQLLPSQWT